MNFLEMDKVVVMDLIVCTKTRRGNGEDDPYRVILEVFTKDGKKIAENDPCSCPICGAFNCKKCFTN